MQAASNTNTLTPVFSVSELTAQIRALLEDTFDEVAVAGEVSNCKVYSSGHWYFSLKDKDATLPCVCFKGNNAAIKFALEDGLKMVARGNISVYAPKGGYQLNVVSLEPVGVGDWQLAFEQLKQKLEAEGLLSPARKRRLPVFPRKIGVVSSLAAAALRDVLTALRRRNSGVNIVISPTRVQGEGSAEEIAAAIALLQELPDIEVILVVRGGGSIEDLWSFNTEVVARAVAASKVPVVSGVGHETDFTICDLVADLRAPTPTAAAELTARGQSELIESRRNLHRRLVDTIDHMLSAASWKLQRFDTARFIHRYQERLKHLQLRAATAQAKLVSDIQYRLLSLEQRWNHAHEKLLALGPSNILGRGFSIVRKLDGVVVRDITHIKEGELLEVLLNKGRLVVSVQLKSKEWNPREEQQ